MKRFPKAIVLIAVALMLVPEISFASLMSGTSTFYNDPGTNTSEAATLDFSISVFDSSHLIYQYTLTNRGYDSDGDGIVAAINRIEVPVNLMGIAPGDAYWIAGPRAATGLVTDNIVAQAAPPFGGLNDVLGFNIDNQYSGGIGIDEYVTFAIISTRSYSSALFKIYDSGTPSLSTYSEAAVNGPVGNNLSVPEPGTLLLLGSGLLGLAGLRRRRISE